MAAAPAGNLVMYRRSSRFGTNKLVLGAAAWAVEGCYRWVGRHSEKGQTPAMPRKKRKLIVAAQRAAEARRIVADLNDRIVTLKASGRSTLEAERALETYISSLRHLEGYERRIREEDKGQKARNQKKRRTTIHRRDQRSTTANPRRRFGCKSPSRRLGCAAKSAWGCIHERARVCVT